MVKIIGLYYEFYEFNENYFTFIEFYEKVNRHEVESYIMELKQTLPCWDTSVITEELNKKYKIKNVISMWGEDFIAI